MKNVSRVNLYSFFAEKKREIQVTEIVKCGPCVRIIQALLGLCSEPASISITINYSLRS